MKDIYVYFSILCIFCIHEIVFPLQLLFGHEKRDKFRKRDQYRVGYVIAKIRDLAETLCWQWQRGGKKGIELCSKKRSSMNCTLEAFALYFSESCMIFASFILALNGADFGLRN